MFLHSLKSSLAALMIGGTLLMAGSTVTQAQAGERGDRDKAAMLGAAAGLLGGAMLGGAIAHANDGYAPPPPPVYDAPRPVYVEPRPVRVAPDPYFDQLGHLKRECDDGDTRDCIRFGILIGEHKEREAQWRRRDPDMFAWDND